MDKEQQTVAPCLAFALIEAGAGSREARELKPSHHTAFLQVRVASATYNQTTAVHRASIWGPLYVRNIPTLAARLYDYVIERRTRILIAALLGLILAGGFKYGLASLLFHEGLTPREMRIQDGLTTGLLACGLVWITLTAARFRREQIRANVKVVGDLNHHIRNAVTVILNSHFLPESAQGSAILESVERIDSTLQRIVPDHAAANKPGPEDPIVAARANGIKKMRARYSRIDGSDSQAS